MNHTDVHWTEGHQANSEPDFYGKWMDASKSLPSDGDYSVFVAFSNGSVEDMRMVHVQDWVRDNNLASDMKDVTVTHWMHMPNHPNITK
jgi:hypothetical protein